MQAGRRPGKAHILDLYPLSPTQELAITHLIDQVKRPREGVLDKAREKIAGILRTSEFDKLLELLRKDDKMALYCLMNKTRASLAYRDTTLGHELVMQNLKLAKASLLDEKIYIIQDPQGWQIVHAVAFYHSAQNPDLAISLLKDKRMSRIPISKTGTTTAHIVVDRSKQGAIYVLDNFREFSDIVDNLGISVIHRASHWFDNPMKDRMYVYCSSKPEKRKE